LDEATEISLKRLESSLATAALRGDKRIECDVAPNEHRPVTIDEVISPVPMNPSCMVFPRFTVWKPTDLS